MRPRKSLSICFAPWNVFPKDTALKRAMEICRRIAELQIPVVTLCGGEPTFYEHIEEVVDALDRSGIQVVLYSNSATEKNREIIRRLLPKVDILSLPVDAVSPVTAIKMRGAHQVDSVVSMMDYLSRLMRRPKVKIGTVVTRQNVSELDKIFDLLIKKGMVDVWRLYQYSPYGKSCEVISRFVLEDSVFAQEVSRIKSRAADSQIIISARSRSENIGYCHIMDSQGGLYKYQEEYLPLGLTIFSEPEEILRCYDSNANLAQKGWQR